MLETIASGWRAVIRGCTPIYRLLEETFDAYAEDRADTVAAALAFYALLSMAPLVIVAVALSGFVLGDATAEGTALRLVRDTAGQTAATTVGAWVKQASDARGAASLVGFVLSLYTASRLSTQLRIGLNQVWNVDTGRVDGFKASVTSYLRRRLFAFFLVLASGPLLLVVFVSRAVLAGFHGTRFWPAPVSGALVEVAQLMFSLLLVTGISAIIFKIVPDRHIGWAAIARGAGFTSLLFNVGNWLVGLYLGRAAVTATYGAAGSVIVVLLWLYFSAQLFLFGAELTQVYEQRYPTRAR